MEHNLSQLLKQADDVALPSGLMRGILVRLEKEAASFERSQRRLWGTVSALSLAAFLASSWYAVTAFSTSNFGSYFSLIFSDGGSIALWWRELGLSLVESLPLLSLGVFLASICAVLWSARKFWTRRGRHFITSIGAKIA